MGKREKVDFVKTENRRELSCYVEGRLYIIKEGGKGWRIILYKEDTGRQKVFRTMQAAAAAARRVQPSEMDKVPVNAAETMLQTVCEVETPEKYVITDSDNDSWILDKQGLTAKRVAEKADVGSASTQFEAVRNGCELIRKYLDEAKEAGKWAWGY